MVIARQAEGGDFEAAPQGLHQAVCIDVIDLGIQETQWGPKHKVKLRWMIDAENSKGFPFWVQAQYTLTLGGGNKKSGLRNALEAWRGREFTKEELDGFDLDQVIGANCQLQVIHKLGDGGKTWANVQAIVPLGKNTPKMRVPQDYVRECNKPPKQGEPQRSPPTSLQAREPMTLEKSYDPPGVPADEIPKEDCPF